MLVKSCLLCHPDTSDESVKGLHIEVKALFQNGILKLHYDVLGVLDQLIIPGFSAPEETHGLWQHACFEAFISVVEETYYHEFNFSPSGQWAAYGFDDYRQPSLWRTQTAPAITYVRSGERLSLEAVINQQDLPDNPQNKRYRLGLTAIIETANGGLSYWALFHPSGKPDFHHRTGFTLSF